MGATPFTKNGKGKNLDFDYHWFTKGWFLKTKHHTSQCFWVNPMPVRKADHNFDTMFLLHAVIFWQQSIL